MFSTPIYELPSALDETPVFTDLISEQSLKRRYFQYINPASRQ